MFSAALSSASSDIRVELLAARDFGYVMGDFIEHEIMIAVPSGYALETGFLPKPGALYDWLDLRQIDWSKQDSQDERRYQLRVTYQIFKGVKEPEKLTIPPLPIHFRGTETLRAETPAWEFVLTPLIPPQTPDEEIFIRHEIPFQTLSLEPYSLRLTLLFLSAFVLLAYLAWWHEFRFLLTGPKRPFARTHRELKKLAKQGSDPEVYRQAMRSMHRALDETAGQTLLAVHLDRFLRSQPAYTELRDELNRFFTGSEQVFFSTPSPLVPAEYPLDRLESLCRQCEQIEKKTV